MPKKSLEISKFTHGIVSNIGEEDSHNESCIDSENIEPIVKAGNIFGRKKDASKANLAEPIKRLERIDDDIIIITDSKDVHQSGFDSISLGASAGIIPNDVTSSQNHNHEIHVGTGNSSNSMWIGRPKNPQFSNSASNNIIVENADIDAPDSLNEIYSCEYLTHNSETYLYGINFWGNFVYKIDVTTGEVVNSHFEDKTILGFHVTGDGAVPDNPTDGLTDSGPSDLPYFWIITRGDNNDYDDIYLKRIRVDHSSDDFDNDRTFTVSGIEDSETLNGASATTPIQPGTRDFSDLAIVNKTSAGSSNNLTTQRLFLYLYKSGSELEYRADRTYVYCGSFPLTGESITVDNVTPRHAHKTADWSDDRHRIGDGLPYEPRLTNASYRGDMEIRVGNAGDINIVQDFQSHLLQLSGTTPVIGKAYWVTIVPHLAYTDDSSLTPLAGAGDNAASGELLHVYFTPSDLFINRLHKKGLCKVSTTLAHDGPTTKVGIVATPENPQFYEGQYQENGGTDYRQYYTYGPIIFTDLGMHDPSSTSREIYTPNTVVNFTDSDYSDGSGTGDFETSVATEIARWINGHDYLDGLDAHRYAIKNGNTPPFAADPVSIAGMYRPLVTRPLALMDDTFGASGDYLPSDNSESNADWNGGSTPSGNRYHYNKYFESFEKDRAGEACPVIYSIDDGRVADNAESDMSIGALHTISSAEISQILPNVDDHIFISEANTIKCIHSWNLYVPDDDAFFYSIGWSYGNGGSGSSYRYIKGEEIDAAPKALAIEDAGTSDPDITFLNSNVGDKFLLGKVTLASPNTFPDIADPLAEGPYHDSQLDLDYTQVSGAGNGFISATVGSSQEYENLFYKTSFIYDGYQESPLSRTYTFVDNSSHTYNADGSSDYNISINLKLRESRLSRRVSAVCVYIAKGFSAIPDSTFRLVKEIPLSNSWYNDASGDYKLYDFTDSNEHQESYSSRSGLTETLDRATPNYTVSAQLNDIHYIGNCGIKGDLADFSKYIFMSNPNRFNQFNWFTDFMILPEKPVALIGYLGRLYAFSKNNTYRINPASFHVEDINEGVGCHSQDSVVISDYGMFYYNKNGIYIHDGKRPIDIGEAIKSKDADNPGLAWEDVDLDNIFSKACYDAKSNSFMIFLNAKTDDLPEDAEQKNILTYNIARKRWDRVVTNDDMTYTYVITSPDGSTYYSDSNKDIYDLFGSATSRKWTWRSKSYDLGDSLQDKFFYKIKIMIKGDKDDITVKYFANDETTGSEIDDADFKSFGTETDNQKSFEFKIPKADRKIKTISLELSGTSEANPVEVKAFSFIYRERSVK